MLHLRRERYMYIHSFKWLKGEYGTIQLSDGIMY